MIYGFKIADWLVCIYVWTAVIMFNKRTEEIIMYEQEFCGITIFTYELFDEGELGGINYEI